MPSEPSFCDRCRNNSHNPHLPCAVHPMGVPNEQTLCPDFEADLNCLPGEWWEPNGASFYGNELVITPMQRWTREQKLALLDWHPLFTDRCPNCECPIAVSTEPQLQPHMDCSSCGWKDDSL